jgi:protein ImuA
MALSAQLDLSSASIVVNGPARACIDLPGAVASLVWRAAAVGTSVHSVVSSGFEALDKELPGGGWPCQTLTELLQVQPATLEWRLLAPCLRSIIAGGQQVLLVGPPRQPHLPGLRHVGIDERHLVWVQAETPAERLWCTEQLVKSNACGALIAWLPQARPEQIRRLQVAAQSCEGPVFVWRPVATRQQSSAAPLRVLATIGLDWALNIEVIKRRGPVHAGSIRLQSVPGGLASVLTDRLIRPSQITKTRGVAANAVGRTTAFAAPRRQPTLQ